MRMTRHAARSFTFEIKRANRRTPEVAPVSRASLPESSPLADQVFGKLSVRPRAPQANKVEILASVRSTTPASQPPEVFGTTGSSAEKSARRVLPDLLSAPVNPIAERVQREADEQAERRRAARASRTTKGAKRSSAATTRKDTTPAVSTATWSAVTEPMNGADQLQAPVAASPQPVKLVATSRKRKRKALLAVFRRAERNGRAVSLLPAGQRWKRRLPQVCW